jgi:7-keto-8-aminopelargonate synthetase-like enzyme
MAQNLKFEQIIKIVNEFSTYGESKGLGKLYTEDTYLDGRLIQIKGKPMINMGSCSYLGLELDSRLKEAAIDAISKYGALFSCSRMYVSCGNYKELEELAEKIFKAYVLITTTVSIGHHSVMPIIIGSNDMVIYDQQAHISMQELSYKLSHYGTGITILRHNRLDELEQKYEQYKSKYDKIWYVIDGVYSMFGDLAPIKEIIKLLDKHKKLHLYVDDAHGVSWAGPRGSGYTLSQTPLHPKMIMGTSMAKGFGSCGGIFLFHDQESRDKVKKWGGPLAYSGPQEPATVAAAIASAKIHLSEEIYDLQNKLQEKIDFCNQLMRENKVPLVSESSSAIFFVACGLPKVAFNLVGRMINEGFYTNIASFPAVPETCSGVRFTMTNHITFEDIENLVKAFVYHHPRALKEEGRTMHDIYKAYRKFTCFESRFGPAESFSIPDSQAPSEENQLKVLQYNTVRQIDKNIWNNLLGYRGTFDYDNLIILEDAFSNHAEKENNWKFYYYIIYDKNNPVVATFFTSSLIKDDLLASENISKSIENIRKDKPYYLTSKTLMMGCQLTNGNHLYLDKANELWHKALILLLDEIWAVQEKNQLNSVMLRDFDTADKDLNLFFINQGFVKVESPDNNVIQNINHYKFDEFLSKRLNSKKRYQIKKEALADAEYFNLKIADNINENGLKKLYNLYLNVKETNLALNTFTLPYKLFEKISKAPNWEILTLHHVDGEAVAAMALCLKTDKNYSHVIFGVDNSVDKANGIYKKMLFHVVKRAFDLGVENLYMGITASDTKRKFGAEQIRQVGYIQVKDKYNQELIDSMSFGSIPG